MANPDFAALGKAFGGWSTRVEKTDDFAPALAEAAGMKGLRLIHLVTDIEYLAAGGITVSALRARGR